MAADTPNDRLLYFAGALNASSELSQRLHGENIRQTLEEILYRRFTLNGRANRLSTLYSGVMQADTF